LHNLAVADFSLAFYAEIAARQIILERKNTRYCWRVFSYLHSNWVLNFYILSSFGVIRQATENR